MLDDSIITSLEELVKECTARIRRLNQSSGGGTAFFIDNRHLITCKHVVKDAKEVTVEPYGRVTRFGTVAEEDAQSDLVLLETEPVAGERPQTAVALNDRLGPRGEFLLAGYPQDPMAPGGIEVRKYSGARRDANNKQVMNLALDAGNNVTFGQSGGALIDTSSGAVVAIARYSKAPKGILGGGCVPVSVAAAHFELVKRYADYPPNAVRAWREALGESAWIKLYQVWMMQGSLDIHVAGKRSRWRVDVERTNPCDPSEAKDPRRDGTIEDLGDGVADVVFEWAHRSVVHSEDQVKLFGRLLSRALFRPRLMADFQAALSNDKTIVRLVIDDRDLVDVPWELAALPDDEDSFLAEDERVRLFRATELSNISQSSQAPRPNARAVGILVNPEEYGEETDEPSSYPGELKASLYSGAIVAPELHDDLELPLTNPELYETESALRQPVEIVHYQGYGRYAATGGQDAAAQLALVDERGKVRWISATKFADLAAQSGARLLVLEFLTARPAMELVRIPASALMAIQTTEAMVFTSAPVQPSQAKAFNKHFYRAVGKGGTVEGAVQGARSMLKSNSPANDHAGFAWFTLAMHGRGGMRLVATGHLAEASSRDRESVSREPPIPADPSRAPAEVVNGIPG